MRALKAILVLLFITSCFGAKNDDDDIQRTMPLIWDSNTDSNNHKALNTNPKITQTSISEHFCDASNADIQSSRGGLGPRVDQENIAKWTTDNHNCYNHSFPNQLSRISYRSKCPNIGKQLRRSHREECNSPLIVPEACELRWYSSDAACNLLRDVEVSFFGDSLTRHIVQTLFSVLTGEFQRGALRPAATGEIFENFCFCNNIYQEHAEFGACRSDTVARYQGSQKLFCPKWTANHIFPHELYKLESIDIPATVENFKKYAMGKRSSTHKIIFVMLGHHFEYNPADTLRFLVPLFQISMDHDVTVILGTQPEVDETLIDPQFRHLTNRELVYKYNDFIRSFVESMNGTKWVLFEEAEITKDALSLDGLHYGQATNVLLTQILLNYIDNIKQGIPTPPNVKAPNSTATSSRTCHWFPILLCSPNQRSQNHSVITKRAANPSPTFTTGE